MADRVGVVTVAHGRHAHLREQRRVLTRVAPGVRHLVVAIDDEEISAVAGPGADVLHLPTDPRGLPLARARNLGVSTAIEAGCALVVLLDVDCVPAPGAVEAYVAAAARAPGSLLAGPVTYLPEGRDVPQDPQDLLALSDPHPSRPAPPAGEVVTGGDHRLFWSLSAALDVATWTRIGGFDEDYVGYGAEDTDFGSRARARGVDLVWVGGAEAFHQHHPVSRPPVEHLEDIVRNATLFHRRWGHWPMSGWLEEFARRGLVDWSEAELTLKTTGGPG
ncbi:glycosyltransferase family 2 protein [Ornithinimicrobium sp. LYQ92]|uniref:glycosyltransferase family 2 protein n=1 Tax=Serinicoccus sp. LYQ92 TaxID=3378798 RepID=UPI003853B497